MNVWPPEANAIAAAVWVTLLTLLLVMLRLRRRAQAEYAARVSAQRLAALADTLQQLLAEISRARTPTAVIEACVPEFLQAVQAAAGAFVLVGDGGRSGEVLRDVGCDNPPTAPPFPLSAYPALEHVAARQVVAAFDAPAPVTDAPRVPALDLLASYRTSVAVPLVTGGRTAGILVLAFHGARNLAVDERDFLLSGGRRTAEALVRARAYETSERERAEADAFRARAHAEIRERQKAEAALRESETKYRALAARTSRLSQLSAALSQAISVGAVAAAIIRHGKVVLGASAGSVALLLPDRSRFEVLYSDERGEQAADAATFAAEAGLCATDVVATRQPVFVGSFADCQQRYWLSASIAATGGFASAAVLPLVVEDAAIGVLGSTSPRRCTSTTNTRPC